MVISSNNQFYLYQERKEEQIAEEDANLDPENKNVVSFNRPFLLHN